jgi:hypothetical protein
MGNMVELILKNVKNLSNREKEMQLLIEEQKTEIEQLKNMIKIYLPYMNFHDHL